MELFRMDPNPWKRELNEIASAKVPARNARMTDLTGVDRERLAP